MRYRQLTRDQRYHIYGLWRAGHSQSDIAKEIGVHKSTIGREIKRNSRWNGYYPEQAEFFSEQKRRHAKKYIRLTDNVKEYIREKLLLDWSPEQISGYAKRHKLCSISHESIYQLIAKDKKIGGNLYLHLRHQRKKYRKRYGSPARSSPIKNRIFIDNRPEVVNTKSRLGDWEIDTIIGKNKKEAIVTLVERVSKKVMCQKLAAKKAALTKQPVIKVLEPFTDVVLTITGDNVLTLKSDSF